MSEVLGCAYDHAHRWLNDLDTGDVCETARVDDLRAAYLVPLPQYGTDVAQVVDHLATASSWGTAWKSGRMVLFLGDQWRFAIGSCSRLAGVRLGSDYGVLRLIPGERCY